MVYFFGLSGICFIIIHFVCDIVSLCPLPTYIKASGLDCTVKNQTKQKKKKKKKTTKKKNNKQQKQQQQQQK